MYQRARIYLKASWKIPLSGEKKEKGRSAKFALKFPPRDGLVCVYTHRGDG